MIKLFVTEVADKILQENFRRLADFFRKDPFQKGKWQFIEIALQASTIDGAYPVTHTPPHNLNFRPKDIITLSVSDGATVTWNYDDFTVDNLSITFSADCTVRAYVGYYRES